MHGTEMRGFLEEVSDLGIVASLNFEGGSAVRKFYPWSSVLSLRSLE